MPDVCRTQCSPSSPSRAPCPPPEMMYMALVVAAPVALIFWFRRRNLQHRPLMEHVVPDQITAIPEDLGATALCSSATPPQDDTAAYRSDGSCSSCGSDDDDGGGGEAGQAELPPALINATLDRSGYVAVILDKLSSDFGGIYLDFGSSDKSTLHPANGVLIQSMEIFCGYTDRVQSLFGTGDYTIEPYSVMFDCWVSKLEEDAKCICQNEKDRRYIFLLNNTYDVWQMMRCPGGPFSNIKLISRLISMIQRYKKSYFDECWVPLTNPCRLDKFTSDFLMISNRQMTWKVTAELRYELRQEIVDLILPSCEVSLLAVEANRSGLPEMVYWLKRVIAGKKKQKKYNVEAVKEVIKELFEG